MRFAEYIWIDGGGKLRSKTKVLNDKEPPPKWSFDGSSTNQATTESSDCLLTPALICPDPLRSNKGDILVLCEVSDFDNKPDRNNHRAETRRLEDKYSVFDTLFGLEQEYTFFKGARPLGIEGSIMPVQGPYYCGVGADEVTGRAIVEEHMRACVDAGLKLSGVNAEVMPGQWEFQVGPLGPTAIGDQVWMARYLLYRIAERHDVTVSLHPKPIKELNGAGMHTNFSTVAMRCKTPENHGLDWCIDGAERLGLAIVDVDEGDDIVEGKVYKASGYPEPYGSDFKARLTGEHETCRHDEFKFAVGDRSGSIRIPTHVARDGCGYIEDRRPCANANPYAVVNYILEAVCEGT